MALDPSLLTALLGGVGTGASSGAVIGATSGAVIGSPTGVGAPIGALVGGGAGAAIGGVVGAGAGLAQFFSDKRAEEAALERDDELEARLADVNNLEQFMSARAVAASGQRQEAQLQGQQAAARGGLSASAGFGLGQEAQRDVDQAFASSIAQAVPGAAQADVMERQQILNEEIQRQQLLDDATAGQDILSSFGQAAGLAVTATKIATDPSTQAAAKSLTTGASTARDAPGSVDVSPPATEGQGLFGAAGGDGIFGAVEGSTEPPETAFEALQRSEPAQKLERAQSGFYSTFSEQLGEDQMETFEAAKEQASMDLLSGEVSEQMFNDIFVQNPAAMSDPVMWRNEVNRRKRLDDDLINDINSGGFLQSNISVSDEMSVFDRQLLAEQLTG